MTSSGSLICIVDDDPLIQRMIQATLIQDGYLVESFESGASFLSVIADRVRKNKSGISSAPYACILLDVEMPEMNGLVVLQRLDRDVHRSPIIMISGKSDINIAVEAMRRGASDFIEKPFRTDQLLAAIRQAIQEAEPLLVEASLHPELVGLSVRELEILQLLVNGDANKIVAFKLGISQRTVEINRARIMDRLHVKTFAALVRKAIAAGL